MEKSNKSQILKLSLIIGLFIITPLLSTSLRPKYLFFVFNLLLISLGIEAGLLNFFSKAAEDKIAPILVAPLLNFLSKAVEDKKAPILVAPILNLFSKAAEDKKGPILVVAPKPDEADGSSNANNGIITPDSCAPKKPMVLQRSFSEKIVGAVVANKLKICPVLPSLFFIGRGETEVEERVKEYEKEDEEEEDDDDEEEEEEEDDDDEKELFGGLNGQELFTQTEIFIGSFHKQLKLQREKSWKRIHGVYQKAS